MYPRSPPTAGKILEFCQPGKDLSANVDQFIQPLPQILHVGSIDPTIFIGGLGVLVQVVAAHLQKICHFWASLVDNPATFRIFVVKKRFL